MPARFRTPLRYLLTSIIILLFVVPVPLLATGYAPEQDLNTTLLAPHLLAALVEAEEDDTMSLVVEFPEGTSPEDMKIALLASGADIEIRHAFEIIPMVSLYTLASEIDALKTADNIQIIALDQRVQIDLDEINSASGFAPADNGDGFIHFTEDLGVQGLWDEGYNGTGSVIAILDSGVDSDHPDLQGKLTGFQDYINGLSDMTPGDGINAYDDNGHGTACAWNAVGDGTANGGNFSGVAPGGSVLGIKVLDSDGSGEDSVIAQAIEFAWQNGADVISLSLGGAWYDDPLFDEPSVAACREVISEGVSVVVAAGNSGPAAFTINSPGITEEAITVGTSVGSNGVVAFSSVGPVLRTSSNPLGYNPKPDVVAPGYGIVSGRASSASLFEYPIYNQSQYGSEYTIWAGTSASTPMIGGIIMLLLDKHTSVTPLQAKTAIMESSTDFGLDPMVQGYGLANATRASEIFDSLSGNIAIMAPMRFPTLPWSSEVLIVGDDRPPQNITVMSTFVAGTLDVEISGNASQYVAATRDTISIGVGYSHFGIALEIPDDLPQSAVGDYVGALELKDGLITVASVDIEFSITLFGGRLLTDMEHHQSNDIDDPSYYGYFSEYLRKRGVVLSEFGASDDLTTTPIDLSTISSADVFMIMDTETPYSASEVNALHTFVENGGTLIVLSEFYDETTSTASYAIDSYNEILAPFGIQCEERGIGDGPGDLGLVYGVSSGGSAESDPLMDGVTDLYIVQGSTLSVNPSVSNAQGLLWQDVGQEHALVATAEYGSGKVFVISDGSTLYDDVLYEAITAGADNLQLLKNLAAEIAFAAPRIYDVEMETGDYGELANVTAFVFDDDLVDVSIEVFSPNNEDIAGTLTENLGYKFETSFIFTSSGFYLLRVVAIDSAGNERIFQKSVLIPVETADDSIVLMVIYSLLGVVGVGLAYVGYQRFVVDRRKKRRRQERSEPQENEWELPPPSIE